MHLLLFKVLETQLAEGLKKIGKKLLLEGKLLAYVLSWI